MGVVEPNDGSQAAPMPETLPPAAEPQNALQRRNGKSLVRELLETLALTAILFFLARATVQPFKVDGHSMDPTLHDSEFILVDKVSYRIGSPQRGDIIVFKFPGDQTRDFIKRVIALPGDTVQVKDQTVYVNNNPLPESYLPASNKPTYDMAAYKVPKGILFVLGDNRNNSYDSHEWGVGAGATPLTDNLVIGKALLAYWPLPDLTFFGHPSYAASK